MTDRQTTGIDLWPPYVPTVRESQGRKAGRILFLMYWLLSEPLPEFPTLSRSFLVSCWDSWALYFCVIFFFSSCGSLAEYPQPFLEFLSVHSYCPVESVSLVIVPGKWLSLLKCPFKTFQRISSLFDHSKLSLFRKGNENCSWECAKVNNNSIQMGKCIFEN